MGDRVEAEDPGVPLERVGVALQGLDGRFAFGMTFEVQDGRLHGDESFLGLGQVDLPEPFPIDVVIHGRSHP